MILQLVQSYPVFTLFVLIFTMYLMTKSKTDQRVDKLLSEFARPPALPLIGSALQMNYNSEELTTLQFENTRRYGERYVMKLFHRYYVFFSNPKDVEKLLGSPVHISKGDTYDLLRPWLLDGLLTSQGKKWQDRRKMLTHAFHFKILEDFIHIFNEQAHILMKILGEDFKDQEGKDISHYLARFTLDVIMETAMDKKINAQLDKDSPYVQAVSKTCCMLTARVTRPWLWLDSIFFLMPIGRACRRELKLLHDFTASVIQERKEAFRSQKATKYDFNPEDSFYGKRRLAFLDLLLEAQMNPDNNLTDIDIREEVDTFMFEGHDTIAVNLTWNVFLLSCHPQCQEKVHEELDRIFEGDRTRPTTSADIVEMKYLEQCIKEALRLYPSVPFLSRYLKNDMVLDDGTIIPSGVNVCTLPMQVHRNPKIYPEPGLYKPERFGPDNVLGRHPFAYIPFSAGPRNCIGQKFAMMELKVVLSHLFRNFQVEAAEAWEDVVLLTEVVSRPRDGHKVRLIPR